jgi:hypothetical protein
MKVPVRIRELPQRDDCRAWRAAGWIPVEKTKHKLVKIVAKTWGRAGKGIWRLYAGKRVRPEASLVPERIHAQARSCSSAFILAASGGRDAGPVNELFTGRAWHCVLS